MGEPRHHCKLWLLLLALAPWLHASTGAATTFTIANYCAYTIWPGTLAGSGTPQLSTTGFELGPGQTVRLAAPPAWSGRMWARTGCVFDAAGAGVCQTGDCGGRMECRGAGATPPATLFEVTLGKGGGEDFYDVSLVDGYNLPVVAIPRALRGPGACNATGCLADLNRSCPTELQVVYGAGAIACRSACEAFGQDRYCCSGAYGTPAACRPTSYSSVFKMACPRAYSYAYDDSTSTFTCSADDYTVAFCLPTSGIKESDAVFLGAQIIGGRGTGAAEANDIAPPAYGNGGAGAYPPPTSDSYSGGGPGGAYLPPVYNYGPGGDRIPPAMRISSASTTTYIRPWLPLLLLLLCFT
ncbi:pathogenesis-related thaumatin-like protein 3.5 [Aegilops tauschii subsp. strangulata]|uniref:Thaumatin-like protein n=2 Tax=Triticinae TaxID=1648030 RepID=A0A3B6MU22_WHEAT|nr:pathogenesis-related thaumatin-like protein 3.5 [Aegilops tauschii subsp. strangulata]XP_044401519.1 pathogenesis-related thaumatin-like protein 3.5 [Triticum aestivum]